MAQVKGDTTRIIQIGSSIKNLGYAQLLMMVVGFIISVIMGIRIISIATRSGSIEEFILNFTGTLRVFLIILLLLTLVGTFFFYRLFQSLKLLEGDTEFGSPLLERATNMIATVIFLQIIGILIGFYFINQIIKDLEELAVNDPTVEGFEKFASELSTSGEVLVTSIFGIVMGLMLLNAFKSIQEWTKELQSRTGIFWFTEAGKKLGNVNIGFMIIIAGQLLNLINLATLGDLFELIGIIVLIVGYVQAGNRLENSFSPDGTPMQRYPSQVGYQQPTHQRTDVIQTPTDSKYCTTCGHSNPVESQFCSKCGGKLI